MGAGWRRSWLLVADALEKIVIFELLLMKNVNTNPPKPCWNDPYDVQ
jgi:hypothetical protein